MSVTYGGGGSSRADAAALLAEWLSEAYLSEEPVEVRLFRNEHGLWEWEATLDELLVAPDSGPSDPSALTPDALVWSADELAERTSGWPSEGRLRDWGRERCTNGSCGAVLTYEGTAAYLHKDRQSDKLVVFCGACSQLVSLEHALRFPLVAL